MTVEIAFRKAGSPKFEVSGAKTVKEWSQVSSNKKPHYRKVLFDEAKVISDLNGHANIVSFRGIFVDIDRPVVVLDSIKGEIRS